LVVVAALLAPTHVVAQQIEWAKLPKMQLERQFAGPLQDTIIQQWRDPVDGTVCYIYLPITAAHSPPMQSGYVQYEADTIGTVNCTMMELATRKGDAPSRTAVPKAR
jgi:hypothetical protein